MDDKTIKTYNYKAEEYKMETDDFWQRFPSKFIDFFISELKGKKLLDIGSGPGRDAEIFRTAGLDVTCIDASEAMVKMTKDKGFDSILGNFNQIPFDDLFFDGVWSYTALLHVHKKDIGGAFEEIYRVMNSGSVLGLGLIEGIGEETKISMGEDYPRHFSYFSKEEVQELALGCGMEEIYFERHLVKTKKYLHFIFKKN